jgi:hypothetical protein
MAKINFKTLSPLPEPEKTEESRTTSKKKDVKPPPPEENEFLETITTEEPAKETVSADDNETFTLEDVEESVKPKESKAKKMRFREMDDSDFSGGHESGWGQESTGGWKKVVVITAILLIIILAGFGLCQYSGVFKNLPFLKKKTTLPQAPMESKPPVPQPAVNPLTGVFQKNLGINSYLNISLQQIIAKKSGTIRFALVVLTPGEINLTVISDASDKVARFKNDLNKSFANLNFTTIATQTKMINRNQMIFADLSTKISPSSLPTSSAAVGDIKSPAAFDQELGSLIKKHRLTLEYLKTGKTIDNGQYQTNHFYLNVSGKKEGVLNFISDISTSFPAAQISKISLNPSNLTTYSDSYLSTRINISYLNPK